MKGIFPRDKFATNKVIRTLTVNDIAYWGAFDMIMVVLALFVVEHVDNASAADVGIALLIYKVSSTISSIPIGTELDSIPGLRDENLGLTLAGFINGTIFILMSFVTQKWQLYLLMVFFGISVSLNLNSWRTLFNKWVDKKKTGTTFGIYQTFYALGTGMMAAIAGFVGAEFGFRVVLVLAGIVAYIGATVPLFIRREVSEYKET